jgi:Tol biopolymer transport system component
MVNARLSRVWPGLVALGFVSALAAGNFVASRDAAAAASFPNFELYSVAVDGTGKRNLTRSRAYDVFPALSRDGRRIAFVRTGFPGDPFDPQIWIMNADGSRPRKLAGPRPLSTHPTRWSPDGSRIAFATGRSESESAVAVVRVDGSGLGNIENASDPSWSPDGGRVVFLSDLSPEFRVGARTISIANADGSARRVVYRLGDFEGRPHAPVWSPRGALIAVAFYQGPGYALYVIDAESGARLQLSPNGYYPSWSPDGRRLAFSNHRGVWVTSVARPNPRRVVGTKGWQPRRPSWSPDGRWIACVTNRFLLVVNAQTGRVRVVARNAREGGAAPLWSPNSRRIIFEGTA